MLKTLCILVLFLCVAFPVRADSIPTYNQTGSFVLNGTNACGGLCVETVSFSFQTTFFAGVNVFDNSPTWFAQIVPGSFNFTATGPLSFPSTPGLSFDQTDFYGNPYFYFISSANDELDMEIFGAVQPITSARPAPLTFSVLRIFVCGGSACANDFGDGYKFKQGTGHIDATLISTPEPSSLLLLLAGILMVGSLCSLYPPHK